MQWREFGLIYMAYMGFLLSRKNYGFWLRPVISELGYAKGQAGLIGSTLEVTYGTCSFLNGVVVRGRPAYAPCATRPTHSVLRGLGHAKSATALALARLYIRPPTRLPSCSSLQSDVHACLVLTDSRRCVRVSAD